MFNEEWESVWRANYKARRKASLVSGVKLPTPKNGQAVIKALLGEAKRIGERLICTGTDDSGRMVYVIEGTTFEARVRL